MENQGSSPSSSSSDAVTNTIRQISSDDKLWVILCHISLAFGAGLFLPLVVYLWKKDSPTVSEHAKEALNFHLAVLIYALICLPLVLIIIGIPLLMVVSIGSIVLAIIATIQASEGKSYRYPYIFRLIP